MVAEAVGGSEVVFGFVLGYFVDYLLKHSVVGERKEYRLNVGIVDADMLHAVLFFVATCELMLLDASFHVVGYICSDHYAVLGAAVHGLCIYVVVLVVVLHEPSVLLECVEVFYSFVVHLGIVLIGARGKVDLRLDDVVE